jgi:hypothetical protein
MQGQMTQEWEISRENLIRSFFLDDSLPLVSFSDSLIQAKTSALPPGSYEGIPVSRKAKESNIVFSFFFVCFLLMAFAFVSKGYVSIVTMVKKMFQTKERENLFSETTGNDFTFYLFLSCQSILLSAIFVFTLYSRTTSYTPSEPKALTILGSFSALIIAFLFIKWLGYRFISYVFYTNSTYHRWIQSWHSLLSFHGLMIFFPTLFFYYIPFLHDFGFYFVVTWFGFSRLIIIYKSYTIFFNSISRLHYLFLYLCAQEIIPLFLLHKGMGYIFNVLENCALWV